MMSNNVLLAIVTPLKYAGPNPLKSMLQTTAESLRCGYMSRCNHRPMACLDMLGRSHTATQAYELVLDGLVSYSGVINQVPILTN